MSNQEVAKHLNQTELNMALYNAVAEGALEKAQALVSDGADIKFRNENGKSTILHAAVQSGHCVLVKWILNIKEAAELIHVKDSEGLTPLFIALDKGNIWAMQLILEQFPDLRNSRIDYEILDEKHRGMTLLHYYVFILIRFQKNEGNLHLFSYVLSLFPNALNDVQGEELACLQDADHLTALEWAVMKSYPTIENIQNEAAKPLFESVEYQKTRALKIVDLFFASGAVLESVQNIECKALKEKFAPLFSLDRIKDITSSDLLDLLKLIAELKGQVNVRSRDFRGCTPLHLAIQYNNTRMVYALLKAGANSDLVNFQGKSSLDLARECPDSLYLNLINCSKAVMLNNMILHFNKFETPKFLMEYVDCLHKITKSPKAIEEKIKSYVVSFVENKEVKAQLETLTTATTSSLLNLLNEIAPNVQQIIHFLSNLPAEEQKKAKEIFAMTMSPVNSIGELMPLDCEAAVAAYLALTMIDNSSELYKEAQRRMYYLLVASVVLVPEEMGKIAVPMARSKVFESQSSSSENLLKKDFLEQKEKTDQLILSLDDDEAENEKTKENANNNGHSNGNCENTHLKIAEEINKITLQFKIKHLFASDPTASELINHIAEYVFGALEGLTKTLDARKIYNEIVQENLQNKPNFVIKLLDLYANKHNQESLLETTFLKRENLKLKTQLVQITDENKQLRERLARLEAQMHVHTQQHKPVVKKIVQFTIEKPKSNSSSVTP